MSRAGSPDFRRLLSVHGSAIACYGQGVLIIGKSGAGKSGLALRLLALGGQLVSDDRVLISLGETNLILSAPDAIKGMIEARGVGLLRAAAIDEAELRLVIDLDLGPDARMPHVQSITILGVEIELMLGLGVPNLDIAIVQMLRCGRVP
jgi:HPr kinase/phosphorylase